MRSRAYRRCLAGGCEEPSRSKGYCSKHYKQFLRHGRLTPEREQVEGCRIRGCKRPHKARGYCSRHYEELRSNGKISNNGSVKGPHCSISDCEGKPKTRGLCKDHYRHYMTNYVKNGYTWEQVDKIVIRHNQTLLFLRNRLRLIRERHKVLKDKMDAENQAKILEDIMGDDDMNDDFLLSEDGLFGEDVWPEAFEHEGCDIW